MLDETFTCVSVKVLTDCQSGQEYYVTNSLVYSGVPVVTGMTMLVDIAGGLHCVTYTSDNDNISSNANVSEIYQLYSICANCNVYPTPTPTVTTTSTFTPTPTNTMTPTNTSTNSPTPSTTATIGSTPPPTPDQTPTQTPTQTTTPTLTPTPSTTPNYVYVYESCDPISPNTLKTQVIQDVKSSLATTEGQYFKVNGICWGYIGKFNTGYVAPPTVFPITYNTDFFTGYNSCVFDDCFTCNTTDLKPRCISTLFTLGPLPLPYMNGNPTLTSIELKTNVQPPTVNCSESILGLTVRRIYYSTTNNPPLLSDDYVDLQLVYGEIITRVNGLTPNTGYYFTQYNENSYGSCSINFPFKVYTLP